MVYGCAVQRFRGLRAWVLCLKVSLILLSGLAESSSICFLPNLGVFGFSEKWRTPYPKYPIVAVSLLSGSPKTVALHEEPPPILDARIVVLLG